jgi:hypothetical protein
MSVRVPVAVRVLLVGVVIGVAALTVATWLGGPSVPAPLGSGRSVVAVEPSPLAVLHDWDARRAAAWSAGDTAALARLYTARSTAGRADVTLLHRYAARGLRVRGMRMQLLGARVLTVRPRVIVLEVVDRLDDAVVVRAGDPGVTRRLPVDAATTHRLELRRVDGLWRMADVSLVASGGARP